VYTHDSDISENGDVRYIDLSILEADSPPKSVGMVRGSAAQSVLFYIHEIKLVLSSSFILLKTQQKARKIDGIDEQGNKATPDYGLGTVGKCLGPTTSKGPTKDGCKIC